LCDFTDQALEGQLSDQELGGFLIATNFSESDGTLRALLVAWSLRSESSDKHTRLIPVRLLDTTGRWGRFASGLGGELLARGFATS
jgi:hypothetical protein